MKKIKLSFIAIACLLFVQNSYAQNANSNIEDEVSDAPNMLWQMVEQAKNDVVFVQSNIFTLNNSVDFTNFAEEAIAISVDKQNLYDLSKENNDALRMLIPMANNQSIELELIKSNIEAEDFQVGTKGIDSRENILYKGGLHYRGIIAGNNQSIAAVSIFENEIFILFADDAGNYNLGKMRDGSENYMLYMDNKLKVKPEFECGTNDYAEPVDDNNVQSNAKVLNNCKIVKCYYECDFAMYTAFNSNTTSTVNYLTSLFNQKATMYANENINIGISQIYVWTSTDPYVTKTSTSTLNAEFSKLTGNTFNGDIANLITTRSIGGGIAQGFSATCNKAAAHCTSFIYTTFAVYPTYSWSVMVLTHEMGHLMGSRHTHACVWNGNNTSIDGCAGFVEGSCSLLGYPSGGGTIMSYCHTQSVGINFTKGFGPLPSALIYNKYNTATCYEGSATLTPKNLTTTNITATGAKLNWTAVNGATTYTIEYKIGSSQKWKVFGTATTNTKTLTGLTPGVSYNWRVKSGCSPFSASKTFLTLTKAGCAIATNLASINITSTTAQLYWSKYATATKYRLSYRLTGTTAWTTKVVTPSNYLLTGLTGFKTYQWKIDTYCGAAYLASSAIDSFKTQTTNAPTTYCTPSTSGTQYEYMNSVVFSNVSKVSGNDNGYGNYTTLVANAVVGTTYPISVNIWKSSLNSLYSVRAWIDYNRDGDFDDANEVVVTVVNSALSTFVANVVIPTGVNYGKTRLRIAFSSGTLIPTPCNYGAGGEYEDYTVLLKAAPSPKISFDNSDTAADSFISLSPNPASNEININWENNDETYENATVINSLAEIVLAQRIENGLNEIRLDIRSLTSGIYFIKLSGVNNSTIHKFVKQ